MKNQVSFLQNTLFSSFRQEQVEKGKSLCFFSVSIYNKSKRILHSGSALAFQARGAGSIPAIRFALLNPKNNVFGKKVRALQNCYLEEIWRM